MKHFKLSYVGAVALCGLTVGAAVEANEHFAREAEASGLASFDARNLRDAMAGEYQENTKMYVGFADAAEKAGDTKVAAMFRQIAADEGDPCWEIRQMEDAVDHATGDSTVLRERFPLAVAECMGFRYSSIICPALTFDQETSR